MALNYSFSQTLELTDLTAKSVTSVPRSLSSFVDQSGTLYFLAACFSNNRVGLYPASGTDGIITSSAISAATVTYKTVGTSPLFANAYRDQSGVVYIAAADSASARVSLFAASGTDGIIDPAVISAATLITKTVGTTPTYVNFYRDQSGIVYIATADDGSNRVSLFAASGTDGIISSSVVSAATLTTKTVGSRPFAFTIYRDQSGTVYVATNDFGSNRVSLFAASGTDGIIDSAVISAATLITKSVGTRPFSISIIRDQSGVVYIATSDDGSNRVSLFAASGTDGIIDSAVISAATLITKSVGSRPRSIAFARDEAGIIYIATADDGSNRVSLFTASGTDGVISSSVISAATVLTRSVGSNPRSLVVHRAAADVFYVVTIDEASNRTSTFPVSGDTGVIDGGFIVLNLVTQPGFETLLFGDSAIVTENTAYFNFDVGVLNRSPLFYGFEYTRDTDSSGTVAEGMLVFSTVTSDISSSTGLTISSGASVRLGKKEAFVVDISFQSGSTLEVFPDSDRAGAPVDLSNFTFAATTTVNVTSGTSTVLVRVGQDSNISAGAGVTISAPVPTLTLTNLVAGSRVYVQNTTDDVELFNEIEATTTWSGTVPSGKALLIRVRNSSGTPNYKTFQTTTGALTSDTSIVINQELDE